jgi:hypothetical protein
MLRLTRQEQRAVWLLLLLLLGGLGGRLGQRTLGDFSSPVPVHDPQTAAFVDQDS